MKTTLVTFEITKFRAFGCNREKSTRYLGLIYYILHGNMCSVLSAWDYWPNRRYWNGSKRQKRDPLVRHLWSAGQSRGSESCDFTLMLLFHGWTGYQLHRIRKTTRPKHDHQHYNQKQQQQHETSHNVHPDKLICLPNAYDRRYGQYEQNYSTFQQKTSEYCRCAWKWILVVSQPDQGRNVSDLKARFSY